jgi:hypothetical protein
LVTCPTLLGNAIVEMMFSGSGALGKLVCSRETVTSDPDACLGRQDAGMDTDITGLMWLDLIQGSLDPGLVSHMYEMTTNPL